MNYFIYSEEAPLSSQDYQNARELERAFARNQISLPCVFGRVWSARVLGKWVSLCTLLEELHSDVSRTLNTLCHRVVQGGRSRRTGSRPAT